MNLEGKNLKKLQLQTNLLTQYDAIEVDETYKKRKDKLEGQLTLQNTRYDKYLSEAASFVGLLFFILGVILAVISLISGVFSTVGHQDLKSGIYTCLGIIFLAGVAVSIEHLPVSCLLFLCKKELREKISSLRQIVEIESMYTVN